MPLELLPLEETDVPAFVEIMWQSFSFEGGMMGLMYPNGFTDAARQHSINRTIKKWREHPDMIKKMKVVDTDLPVDDPLGRIVGASDWEFHPKDRTEAELAAEEEEGKKDGLPPDCNPELMMAFFSAISKASKPHLGGKAHVRLHILVTLPKHHRRGIGAKHLNWGFEQADKLGLPVWLEGSPMGTPLYTRTGFETVGWLDFDAREWGSKEEIHHALMLKPAKNPEIAK
jgi:GNAT superfamily N-acetyltransferase